MFKIVEKRLESKDKPYAKWRKKFPDLMSNRSEFTLRSKELTKKEGVFALNVEGLEGDKEALVRDTSKNLTFIEKLKLDGNGPSTSKQKTEDSPIKFIDSPNSSSVIPRIRISSETDDVESS